MDPMIFRKISYGLFVIASTKDGKINGQIANTCFQITSEPATVAIGINKNNLTNEFIKNSGVFTVSILPHSVPLDLIGHFGFKSGREMDKFATIPYKLGETGAPYLVENSIGYLEAQLVESMELETHTLFVGKVVKAAVFSEEEPLTYTNYHLRKAGKTVQKQEKAIPVEKPKENSGDTATKKYLCTVCGYIYDPKIGDPDSGVAPGTAFEDIPDDWICPICGVGKDDFEPVD